MVIILVTNTGKQRKGLCKHLFYHCQSHFYNHTVVAVNRKVGLELTTAVTTFGIRLETTWTFRNVGSVQTTPSTIYNQVIFCCHDNQRQTLQPWLICQPSSHCNFFKDTKSKSEICDLVPNSAHKYANIVAAAASTWVNNPVVQWVQMIMKLRIFNNTHFNFSPDLHKKTF